MIIKRPPSFKELHEQLKQIVALLPEEKGEDEDSISSRAIQMLMYRLEKYAELEINLTKTIASAFSSELFNALSQITAKTECDFTQDKYRKMRLLYLAVVHVLRSLYSKNYYNKLISVKKSEVQHEIQQHLANFTSLIYPISEKDGTSFEERPILPKSIKSYDVDLYAKKSLKYCSIDGMIIDSHYYFGIEKILMYQFFESISAQQKEDYFKKVSTVAKEIYIAPESITFLKQIIPFQLHTKFIDSISGDTNLVKYVKSDTTRLSNLKIKELHTPLFQNGFNEPDTGAKTLVTESALRNPLYLQELAEEKPQHQSTLLLAIAKTGVKPALIILKDPTLRAALFGIQEHGHLFKLQAMEKIAVIAKAQPETVPHIFSHFTLKRIFFSPGPIASAMELKSIALSNSKSAFYIILNEELARIISQSSLEDVEDEFFVNMTATFPNHNELINLYKKMSTQPVQTDPQKILFSQRFKTAETDLFSTFDDSSREDFSYASKI